MRNVFSLVPWLLVLSSCSSPPKPPTVNESMKRPANLAVAIDLQTCKSNLHNTRISATESDRIAESAAATLERVSARQQAIAAMQAALTPAAPANSVFSLRFGFGSTLVNIPADMASTLIENARTAPLVLLRGRTDGAIESAAESRIARERATAVRDYLVKAGVDSARIRSTYQPAGDYVADNSGPSGRALNRRVEIEVYRAIPVAISSAAVTPP